MGVVRDACIVAGGRGTRLQPLTYAAPKPLLPFCGAPFLAGVIHRLAAVGIERVLLVVGADTAPFEALRPYADEVGVTIEMVPEPEPLDTAGGVRAVADRLDATFLVLNGDILTDLDYGSVLLRHAAVQADATLVLTEVEDTSTYGVCVLDGSRIVAFVEKPPPGTLPDQRAINAGTYVLEPHVLRAFPQGRLSFERQVFPGVVEQGLHLEGYVAEGVWADLGTPERYLEGHRLALDGELAWPFVEQVPEREPGIRVAAGAHVADGATLQAPVLVGDGALVEAGAAVGPYAVVGAGGRIRPHARVRDSVLFDRVEVGEGVEVERLLAGHDVRIAASRLGTDVVLGNGEVVEGRDLGIGARVPAASG